jgi:branched-chain amino acid transport system substrate-binding protein
MKVKPLAPWLGAALVAALNAAVPGAIAQEPEFHLGIVASVTGPFAAATKDTFDGLNAWVKNEGLPGRKFVQDILDDETNAVNAANLFRRLASDPKTNMIMLNVNSASAIAAKAFASEYKVPIISGGGAAALGYPADPWMFKVAPANRDSMTVILEYMKKHGMKKLAHLYSTDTYGEYDLAALKELSPQYGVELVAEGFAADDTSFNAQFTRIRAEKPDLIYSSASARAAILSFKTYKELAITTPLCVTQAAISVAMFNAIGGPQAADGLLSPTQLGVFGEKAGGDTARLYAALKQALGHTPVYFNTFGYDAGIIIGAGVKGSDGSRQGIRDALERLKDLPAINGPVTYTKDNHTGQDFRSIAMGRMENGVAVPAD